MAESKTKPTAVSVDDYLASLPDQRKAVDARLLIQMMNEITGEPPVMWGPTMIGFGNWHYVYETGTHGDAFFTGFAPRSAALTIYLTAGLDVVQDELARLGKHKVGKGCLYIKRLSDIDLTVLREMIAKSDALTRNRASRQNSEKVAK